MQHVGEAGSFKRFSISCVVVFGIPVDLCVVAVRTVFQKESKLSASADVSIL